MSALDKLAEMKAAAQANVDALAALEADVKALQEVPPVAGEDFKAELEKAKADAAGVVAERDALRAAIKSHIDDEKTDTAKLEKALEPIEVAPAPVVPEAPAPVEPAPAPVVDPAPVLGEDAGGHNVEVQPEP